MVGWGCCYNATLRLLIDCHAVNGVAGECHALLHLLRYLTVGVPEVATVRLRIHTSTLFGIVSMLYASDPLIIPMDRFVMFLGALMVILAVDRWA